MSANAVWWSRLTVCPGCGASELSERIAAICPGQGTCSACGAAWVRTGTSVTWSPADAGTTAGGHKAAAQDVRPTLGSYLSYLGDCLHPLWGRWSPVAALGRHRVERFYRRTRTDPALAAKWKGRYLQGLDLPSGGIALDHGCGRGRHVALLKQIGWNVVGQDCAPHADWDLLSEDRPESQLSDSTSGKADPRPASGSAGHSPGFQVVPSQMHRLPWRSGAFDLVLDFLVVVYLLPRALEAHIAEVRRILRPGGYWLVLEPNLQSYAAGRLREINGNLNDPDWVRERCSAQGFQEQDFSYEAFYAPVLALPINFFRKQLAPWPLDVADFDSWLAAAIPPSRRGLWLMRQRLVG